MPDRSMGVACDVTLAVYRAARERSIDEFQECAIGLIKPLLGFHAAFWGTGRLGNPGLAVHAAHLHEVSPAAMAEWQALNPQDKVIPTVVANPGVPQVFHAPTLFKHRHEAPMREFARRAGWQCGLVTGFMCDGSELQWVSLYRPNPEQPYSSQERRMAATLVPHLVEAQTINCLVHLYEPSGVESMAEPFLAWCDVSGRLHYADPRFVSLLETEWPGWRGGWLPHQLTIAPTTGGHAFYAGRRITVEARAALPAVLLRARKKMQLQDLSSRESEVATLFARGRKYKQIARDLCLTPATVRHHLSSIYSKLGVHDKAELAQRLAIKD
jgi:DNA-binding CsgD family transcriptional regulator